MRITLFPLVAGALLLSTQLATADVTIATSTGQTVLVHRVTADKVDKLGEDRGTGLVGYAFSDAKTVWVLRRAGAAYTISKVVEGKLEVVKPLALTMATAADVPTGFDLTPGLIATKSGKVLVTTCLAIAKAAAGDATVKCETGYLQVDTNTFSKDRPKDVVFGFGATKMPRPATLKKVPKSYNVKITRTKLKNNETYTGFTCTGPDGKSMVWPTDADNPPEAKLTPAVQKATWLAETPALVHIEATGTAPTPGKEKLYQEWYVVDCTSKVAAVRALRDGLWMTDDQVRKANGDVIGKLPGDAFVMAP